MRAIPPFWPLSLGCDLCLGGVGRLAGGFFILPLSLNHYLHIPADARKVRAQRLLGARGGVIVSCMGRRNGQKRAKASDEGFRHPLSLNCLPFHSMVHNANPIADRFI